MDLASLGVRIETAEVKSGHAELDKLTVSAEKAEVAVERLGPSSAAASKQVGQLAAGARTVGPALAAQTQQFQTAGISAKQYAFALRTVPAQITDIVTGLASGQNPFLVAIQQGGQLRDVFGGFGNALRALLTTIGPVGLSIAALAAAAGSTVAVLNAGQRESFEFEKALALSGNAAGFTRDQLRELARELDGIAGSEAQAANTLALLASTGQVAGERLKEFAIVAQKLERTVGIPVEETVKKFAALGADPVNAAKKLNQQYNFLTASTLAQARALEEQGRTSEAANLVLDEFLGSQEKAVQKVQASLGSIQQLGQEIAKSFQIAKNAILSLGREETGAEKLADLQEQLQRARKSPVTSELFGDSVASLERQVEQQEKINFNAKIAAGIEASRVATERLLIELQEEEGKKKRELAAQAEQLRKAEVGFDIAGIKRALDAQTDAFANSEAELDALRSAGLVRDQEFFDKRRQLIEQNTAAQVAALQQQNERLMKEKTTGVAQLMNQQAIRENEAEIQRLRGAGISQLKVLDTQQQAAGAALKRQYEESRAAAEDFIKTLDKQFSRQIELQGAGSKARQREGDRNSLNDRFEAQRDDLRGELRRGEITQETFDQQLALIDEFNAKALNSQDKFFERLDQNQSDFFIGAREAINNYIDDASNFSKASENLLTNAFTGAEDALVRFATTGKLSFKDLANSIIQDLIRIQVRALIVRAIAGSGVLSGGASAGASAGASIAARASGGPVSSGQPYLVGERGPELFVPRSSGQIIPTKQTMQLMSGRTTSATVVQNINISGGGMDPGAVRRMGEEIRQQAIAGARTAIAEDLRRGRLDTQLQGAQR